MHSISIHDIFITVEKITVPSGQTARRFSRLHWEYSQTFLQINAIIRGYVPLKELKELIGGQYSDLEEVVEYAQNTDEIMKLFRKNLCNFPYFHELWGLVDMLALEEATRKIDQYEEKQKEYYKEILTQDFAKQAIKAYDENNNVEVSIASHHMREFGNHISSHPILCWPEFRLIAIMY